MRKEHIIWLLFPMIWIFWFFFMQGHIGNWEGSNFFQNGCHYWSGFLLKPGGWSEYIGYFLLQFYQQTWFGALIATLLPFGLFFFTRSIVGKLGIQKLQLLISAVPLVLICLFMVHQQAALSEALKIFFFFLLVWAYGRIPCAMVRYGLFTLGYPLFFLLLGGGISLLLYVIFTFIEVIRKEGKMRWLFIFVSLLLATCLPIIWKQLYVTPTGSLYYIASGENYSLWGIYGYNILLLGLAQMNSWRKENKKNITSMIELSLVIVGCSMAIYQVYDPKSEAFFHLEQATMQGKWKQVIEQIGKLKEELTREEMYMLSLALANQGELGNRLFEYPVWGLGCLYLPRTMDYKNNLLGGEFYYRLKIPNEAIHWTFQASVASPQGMDFCTLRRLIELNVMKKDSLLADKYLTILENTWIDNSWCKQKREELRSPQTTFVLPDNRQDFFIGGRPFLSDLARVLDAGRSKDMTMDYLLSALLLNKDLNKFCQLFMMFYTSEQGKISKAYQEALMVAMTAGNQTVAAKNYEIDKEVMERFQDYNILFRTCNKNKEQGRELMKNFRGTWWYYFHFVDPKPVNERGNMMNFQYSI